MAEETRVGFHRDLEEIDQKVVQLFAMVAESYSLRRLLKTSLTAITARSDQGNLKMLGAVNSIGLFAESGERFILPSQLFRE